MWLDWDGTENVLEVFPWYRNFVEIFLGDYYLGHKISLILIPKIVIHCPMQFTIHTLHETADSTWIYHVLVFRSIIGQIDLWDKVSLCYLISHTKVVHISLSKEIKGKCNYRFCHIICRTTLAHYNCRIGTITFQWWP